MTICCIVTYYDGEAAPDITVEKGFRYVIIGEADPAGGYSMATLIKLQAGAPQECVGRVDANRGDAATLLESALSFLDQFHPRMHRIVGNVASD